jgi:hypothetical protein
MKNYAYANKCINTTMSLRILITFMNKNQKSIVSIAVFATVLIILSIALITDNSFTYAKHNKKLRGGNFHSPLVAKFEHHLPTSSQFGGQQCLPGQFCPSHP